LAAPNLPPSVALTVGIIFAAIAFCMLWSWAFIIPFVMTVFAVGFVCMAFKR
jgi:hypothetical protein